MTHVRQGTSDSGRSYWVPECVAHDGWVWQGPQTYDESLARTNAGLHETHHHHDDQGELW